MEHPILIEHFIVKERAYTVPDGVGILPHAAYENLVHANEILAQANAKARLIEEQAQALFEQERQRGYEQGLQEGKMLIAEQSMDLIAEKLNFLENMETSTVDLVMTALAKVLEEMPPQERVVNAVKRAVAYVRNQKKVTLRISPEDEPFVQQALASIKTAYPAIDIFDIYADKRLQSGDCLLESELGIIDAGLKTQLQNIERAFMKNLSPKE